MRRERRTGREDGRGGTREEKVRLQDKRKSKDLQVRSDVRGVRWSKEDEKHGNVEKQATENMLVHGKAP